MSPVGVYPRPSPETRFWAQTIRHDPDGCWEWHGRKNENGYGMLRVGGKNTRAHRFAYELLVGPIPPGLDLDHICHNTDEMCLGGISCHHRACVNPKHLEPVTNSVNVLRGKTFANRHAAQTECKNGHSFTKDNTYTRARPEGGRECRACRKERNALRGAIR